MQDKPELIPAESTESAPIRTSRARRVGRWFKRRRKTLAFHVVRGAAYGAGVGCVGLIVWWIENH
ncbi:hypothetical protein ABZY31_11035 [Streptomyces sp. NPDC006529]|uniref:hypothetical protein n=1 Tax=Streptomyces sp. NPDC006529 TaxID=3157177 RepID=UPI0033B7E41B